MTRTLNLAPSRQEEYIKPIRKLRWIGLEKESDNFQLVRSETGDAPEPIEPDAHDLAKMTIFESNRKVKAISELSW